MPDRSLAEELRRAGMDPWLLDLRGHGLARQGHSPRGWSIDDYGRHDIPAAIAHIREVTGAERVGYVGHSMGGMVAAPYLHHHGQGALWGLVIVASPYDFRGDDDFMRLARRAARGGRALPAVHGDQAGRLAADWKDLPTRLDELIWARGSVGPEAQSLALRGALSPMYRGELGQLAEQLGRSAWSSLDGVDWLQSAASWRLPLLVLAGRGDRIAPPDRVRPLYEQAGSADKSWLLYGRAQGHSHDYGHVDLLLGEEAGREVLPQISAWLAGRAPLPTP
jgi:polyhydroxyalkanoate synthase